MRRCKPPTHPSESIADSMHHDIAAGRDAERLCARRVRGIGIRHVKRAMKPTGLEPAVDAKHTLRNTIVSLSLFVPEATATERNAVDLERRVAVKECHAMRRLLDDEAIAACRRRQSRTRLTSTTGDDEEESRDEHAVTQTTHKLT